MRKQNFNGFGYLLLVSVKILLLMLLFPNQLTDVENLCG